MADAAFITIEGPALQTLNRIMAQTGRSAEDSIAFALSSVDHFLKMIPGQSVVITKKIGESDLFISDILSDPAADGDGR